MGRRWFKIGAGSAAGVTTIVTLLLFLVSHYGFEITGTDDICTGRINPDWDGVDMSVYDRPCISYIGIKNPTGDYVDVFNQNQIQLGFSPSVREYHLFRKDGRCKGGDSCAAPNGVSLSGWNFIDFTNETKPLKDKVYVYRFPAYTTKEFLLWGLKHNPTDRVKWTLTLDLEGLRNGELDPIWEGETIGDFTLLNDCKDIIKERNVLKSIEVFIDCSLNATCEDHYENQTIYVKEEYLDEDCDEVGVKVGDKEIMYRQKQVNCLRTDNILCCWLYEDGGNVIAGRKGEARITIFSGEKGECRDLNDDLKVLMKRGNVKIDYTLTEVAK